MWDRLLRNGLAGQFSEASDAVATALRTAGVSTIAAEYAEDPVALARLSETTIVWYVGDVGVARCSVTISLLPPHQRPRGDPITVALTPWPEVQGITISTTVDRPTEPRTTLKVTASSPTLELTSDSDASDQRLLRLQAFAAAILERLSGRNP